MIVTAYVTYGNCDSKHGIFWHPQKEGKYGYWLWNDYEPQLMTTGVHLFVNEDIWVGRASKAGDWKTWASYTPGL
jgi:hypothetical protein